LWENTIKKLINTYIRVLLKHMNSKLFFLGLLVSSFSLQGSSNEKFVLKYSVADFLLGRPATRVCTLEIPVGAETHCVVVDESLYVTITTRGRTPTGNVPIVSTTVKKIVLPYTIEQAALATRTEKRGELKIVIPNISETQAESGS
jgi:hypothetical protein